MATSKSDITPEARKAFKEFCALDDDIKRHGATMKQARLLLKASKKAILDWMTAADVHKVGRNTSSGINVFSRVEKDVYVRPTQDQQSQKMAELIRDGITDPVEIIQQLKTCAGTRTETRLYRRRPKSKNKDAPSKKKQKKEKKKRKKTVTFSEDT